MIRFRIPVPGTQGRVTRSRENANLARLIRRTGISQATYTVEQQAFTTTGGTGTKNLIQIALAIDPGWMEAHRRLEVHRGVQVVLRGHERHHATDAVSYTHLTLPTILRV